jgi:DNA processing protein
MDGDDLSAGRAARSALVSLNGCPRLDRGTICRLGVTWARWWGRAIGPRDVAAELALPARAVERAFAYLERHCGAAAREEERLAALGGRIVTLLDPDYPAGLRDLSLPPPVLEVKGEAWTGATAAPAVAVVGSRRMDAYGQEAATLFARDLAAAGVVVVSGFARGVDSTAHRAALAAGGLTVAVLGCGLDVDYPTGQGKLAAAVERGGARLSEFPLGTGPWRANFPVRNRIIAALASATLVIQGALRSGSRVTAHLALDLGRDVFAVPSRIFDERAMGTNRLLSEGAHPALHPRDLLDRLGIAPALTSAGPAARDAPPNGWPEKLLRALVPGEPVTAEALAERTGCDVDTALGALLELELLGWARRHPGPLFARAV